MERNIIVRIQSKDGTKRIQTHPNQQLGQVLGQIRSLFSLEDRQTIHLFRSPGHRNALTSAFINVQLHNIPIQHGDMLYMLVEDPAVGGDSLPSNDQSKSGIIVEDDIDVLLRKKDGKIYRGRDTQLCHHGPQGRCLNCSPLEPWDTKYLESRDPPIKHLSFHCYLRKLTSGVDKGKFVNLEDISCKIKPNCTGHAPWPEGICTKCQPSAITLARQVYRHVDNIMFEDSAIVDRFIGGWRKSGVQRIGYLYGRYEEYDEVPLGIKAVVAAIYEPPQSGTPYSVQIEEDPQAKLVDEMASHLGLRRVGWIFTDLEPEENGKVAYKRSIDTHLLSAEECIMAAHFQMSNPNTCTQARDGTFGSKFVTVCVSGNESNQGDTKGYQVSNQCVSLVRDDCFIPTIDAPELGYIKESTNEQYVPDVFYKGKDEYGIEVTKLARPLPLEYLIVELTTTTPLRPKASLPGGRGEPFPVENREGMGEIQSFDLFIKYLDQQKGSNFLCTTSDFHFLYFLYTTSVVHLQPHLFELCKAVKEQDRLGAERWRAGEWWQHVEQLIIASSMPSPMSEMRPPLFPVHSSLEEQRQSLNDIDKKMEGKDAAVSVTGEKWSCQYCTLHNEMMSTVCNACGLPRN